MSVRIDIDAHGRVIPADDEARTALADRAGAFALLPTAPDLLVARRTPAAGGSAPAPRCIVAGDLSGIAIAEFVAFVHQSRLSGLLTVSSAAIERSLVFKDGDVRGARSTGPGERIGEVALRLGFVDARQLEAAVAAGKPIGKALVERGALSAADLWKCIHEQVAVVFHAVLLAREGVFTLVEDAEVELASTLSMNTQALLMDGIRRVDEMALFRARIPGPDAHVRRRPGRAATALDGVEQEVLALVEEPRRVLEVAQRLRMNEFDATKILYHLAEAGHVDVFTEPIASPEVQASRAATLVAGMNEILRLVAADVAAAGVLEPFVAGVRSFLSDPVNRFAPLWRMLALARDGSIDGARVLRNVAELPPEALAALGPSADRGRYLFEGLRELMFFYLFQAGEVLPQPMDDRLSVEVKRRVEALGDLR